MGEMLVVGWRLSIDDGRFYAHQAYHTGYGYRQ